MLTPVFQLLRQGDRRGAADRCRDLLRQVPADPEIHHAMGLCLLGLGAHELAAAHLERARELGDHGARLARDLAATYAVLRRWHDAARVLEPQLEHLDPQALALYLASSVESGAAGRAIDILRQLRVTSLEDHPEVACEYGRALYAAGEAAPAEQVLLRCFEIDPAAWRARRALALLYDSMDRSDLAFEQWNAYATMQPGSGHAQLRLAVAHAERGRMDESRAARSAALGLGLPPEDYSTALYLMLFDPEETGETLLAACRRAFTAPIPSMPRCTLPRGGQRHGRPRVGYVSGQFTRPPASHFLRPFLANHDRAQLDVFLYSTDDSARAAPPWYRHEHDRWRDVARVPDEELVSILASDRLDVLVDLSGHFPDNRLAMFARRIAAVQATFPNYPGTTGCPEMDYLFTDAWTSPKGTEHEYSESLYRLQSGYLAYAPPDEAPPVAPLPARRKGHVTFGIFQRPLKLSPVMWDLFADVLRSSPDARLLVHYDDSELDRADSTMSRWLRAQLESRDVDGRRLVLAGRRPLAGHLDLMAEVDIALDTWPFGGQTTTMECLWMGVPLVTLTGRTHASRVSGALVARAGLPQLVASARASYVGIAGALCADVDALGEIRAALRGRVIDSGLTDGRALARAMEHAYLEWAGACRC